MAEGKRGSFGISSVSSLSSIGSGSSSTHISSLKASGNVAAPFCISLSMPNRALEGSQGQNAEPGEKVAETRKSFVQQVSSVNSTYASMLPSKLSYEFKLVHGKKCFHWFFLLKIKDSQLPYLTLEIQTSDLHGLIPTVQNIENGDISITEAFSHSNTTVLTDLDVYDGRLQDLCEIADEVVEAMKEYNMVSSNCQHFCNNVLNKLGRKTFSTTVGHQCTQCKAYRKP